MAKTKKLQIATVGSRLHQLDTETSDHDRAEIYAMDTVNLVMMGHHQKNIQTQDIEGDITRYEIGTLASQAMKGNPTALEALLSDKIVWHNESDIYLMAKLQALKDTVRYGVSGDLDRNAAIGMAQGNMVAAVKGIRTRKSLVNANYVLLQAIDFLTHTDSVYNFDFGRDTLDADIGWLFEDCMGLVEKLEEMPIMRPGELDADSEVRNIIYDIRKYN